MLHDFLTSNAPELIRRCKAKVAQRPSPPPTSVDLEYGIPVLIGQLVEALRDRAATSADAEKSEPPRGIGSAAAKHGQELLRKGFTVEQVVHDYGDLCQAVTELAQEDRIPITVEEFHTFNRCLDHAIAGAVTAFGRDRDEVISAEDAKTMNERIGFLAHELRNNLNTAMLALHAIRSGNGALNGATGAVLDRSLKGLTNLVNRSLAEVRLNAGLEVNKESIALVDLIQNVSVFASMEAKAKGLTFEISAPDAMTVVADRQLLSSALANLLQNALKFTPRGGHVWLRARPVGDRILVEIEDECGGLPPGKSETLFQPFQQRSKDRTGLGLGLSIVRRGIEANNGKVSVRDLPARGCIFTIDLPRAVIGLVL